MAGWSDADPGTPVIALHDAAFGWRGQPAVRAVSGGFARGSMTAIAGPNGAGKSTLVKGIMGLLRPLAGTVRVAAAERARLAWLPQAADLDRGFPVTVLDMVAMGGWRRVGAWRGFGRQETRRAWQALETVGLAGEAGRIVGTLSGGQMQRALFARLLVQDAQVLLLDEPFAAVDSDTADTLMRLLCGLHREGRTVIAVLHDLGLVRRHFSQTLLLAGRPVAWGATGEVLTAANLCAARGAAEPWL
ncbi:metal ABC transporter ATP-binding protein [Bordetella petrii]|uniref:metal ABC transporter ATP-binding protein n=1 Tax=Bordetella petrii TaxID=94624 RepID=UPI00372F9E37